MKQPDWTKNATLYEVNVRNFSQGGTFAEFEQHLPRLKNLGVNILWFMPIYPIGELKRKGTLGSFYSVKNYTAVNPQHGTLDDFKNLVKKIHDLGMYVILDWVANHTAWDNNWIYENPDFYSKDLFGNIIPPNPDWEDVAHLNYKNPALRKTMIEAMQFWIKEADIDGFRCDMAHLVPTSFWNEARPALEKLKNVFMLAESENRDLLDHAFDSLYGWNLLHVVNDLARGKYNVSHLDYVMGNDVYTYPEGKLQLLFTENHDENTWSGSAIERLGYALEVFNVMMFTLPGMPLIYSGQESGNYHRLSMFEKECIEWKDDKMTQFYQQLNQLKNKSTALQAGKNAGAMFRLTNTCNNAVFSFIRKHENNEVLVLLNLTQHDQHFILNSPFTGEFKSIFTNRKINVKHNTAFTLEGWGYDVLEKI